MKSFRFKVIHLWILVAVAALSFQNCSQSPFGKLGFEVQDSNDNSESFDSVADKPTVPYALLSGEQMFKSMISVTGVSPTTQINDEYSGVAGVFATSNDIRQTTSAMMIGAANLASRFCSESAIQTSVKDNLFPGIDFGKSSMEITDQAFQDSVQRMGQAFWGRMPSSDEMAIIYDAKSEFLSEYSDSERQAVDSSSKLMLFTCTAMLVSFDAISF